MPQVITLNRPLEKNALNDTLTDGLVIALERVKQSPKLRVVFITGAGSMFCAGGDPKTFQAIPHVLTARQQPRHTVYMWRMLLTARQQPRHAVYM